MGTVTDCYNPYEVKNTVSLAHLGAIGRCGLPSANRYQKQIDTP